MDALHTKSIYAFFMGAVVIVLSACGGGSGSSSSTPPPGSGVVSSSLASSSISSTASSSSSTSISVQSSSSSSSSSSQILASKLELKTDTYLTIANGVSAANLSCAAYDKNDAIIQNAKCVISANGTSLSSSVFTTNIPGVFKIKAAIGDTVSNTVEINARKDIAYEEISIPIIFHVGHFGEPIGTGNNLSQAEIANILASLNAAFSKPVGSKNPNAVDMKIVFRLAKYNKDNQLLAEAGIDRVNLNDLDNHVGFVNNQIVFNNMNFSLNTEIDIAGDKLIGPNEASLLTFQTFWNPYEYRNVWLMPTMYKESYAQFPMTYVKDIIPGLEYSVPSDKYPDVIVVNTLAASQSIAHEIGHSLGLPHTFSNDSCKTTDYSPDTYTYSRAGTKFDCEGNLAPNLLDNFMGYDFEFGLTTVFTYDQRERVRAAFIYSAWLDKLKTSTK